MNVKNTEKNKTRFAFNPMPNKSTKIETKFCEFWVFYKIFVWEIQLWFVFFKGNEFITNNSLIVESKKFLK
jgi:hypothetical protein